jgi:hypothetical protein
LLLSIVDNSSFEFCNVICTPFWELELCDIVREPGVCNKELLCIFEVVTEKDLKIMKKDPKFKNMLRDSMFILLDCVFSILLYVS